MSQAVTWEAACVWRSWLVSIALSWIALGAIALACGTLGSVASAQDLDLGLDEDDDSAEHGSSAPEPADQEPSEGASTDEAPDKAAGAAAADDASSVEAARSHFQRGVDYYTEGDFRAALIEFERAYAIQPTYRLLYNLGQVAYELRDYAGAERYFTRYLVEGEDELTQDRRTEVKTELERLRTRVASVALRADQAGASIRIDDRAVTDYESGPVRLSAGRRRIVAEKSGYAPVRKVIDVVGGETIAVELHFGPALLSGSGPRSEASSSSAWPWVIGIATGLAAVGGAGFGFAAYRDATTYDEQLRRYTTHAELEKLSAQAQTKAVIADVLFGTAAVGAVATLVLVLASGGSEKPKPASSPTVKLTNTSLSVKF